jgi:hypothetical protein
MLVAPKPDNRLQNNTESRHIDKRLTLIASSQRPKKKTQQLEKTFKKMSCRQSLKKNLQTFLPKILKIKGLTQSDNDDIDNSVDQVATTLLLTDGDGPAAAAPTSAGASTLLLSSSKLILVLLCSLAFIIIQRIQQ